MNKIKNVLKSMILSITSFTPTFSMAREENEASLQIPIKDRVLWAINEKKNKLMKRKQSLAKRSKKPERYYINIKNLNRQIKLRENEINHLEIILKNITTINKNGIKSLEASHPVLNINKLSQTSLSPIINSSNIFLTNITLNEIHLINFEILQFVRLPLLETLELSTTYHVFLPSFIKFCVKASLPYDSKISITDADLILNDPHISRSNVVIKTLTLLLPDNDSSDEDEANELQYFDGLPIFSLDCINNDNLLYKSCYYNNSGNNYIREQLYKKQKLIYNNPREYKKKFLTTSLSKTTY